MKRVFTLMLALCLLMTSSSIALMEENTDTILAATEFVSDEAEASVSEVEEFALGEEAQPAADAQPEADVQPEADAQPAAETESVSDALPEAAAPAEIEVQPEAEAQPTAEPEAVEAVDQTLVAAAAPTVVQFTLTKKSSATLAMPNTMQINLAEGVTAKKFASSKKSVATVSATGLVTPKKAGKTKITVTLNTAKKKTIALTLTVKDPTIPTSVYLSKDGSAKLTGTITVNMGTPLTLIPVLNSAEAKTTYKWTSSKKKIASISAAGVVTPKKAGTTKITVKTVRGKKKASIKVKVVDPYKATAVALNKTGTVLLPKGSTLALTATMTPANSTSKLTWSSSNKKIATVSKTGVVTGKKKGTAKITVKTSTGKKASMKVKVVPAAGTATGMFVELPPEGVILNPGNTEILQMTLNPYQSNGNVTWTSSDTYVIQVLRSYRNNDLTFGADIKALHVGKATITVKDSVSGISKTFTVTVNSLAEPGSITFRGLSGNTKTMTVGAKANVDYDVWDKGDTTASNSLLHAANHATVTLPGGTASTVSSQVSKVENNICSITYDAHNAWHTNGRCQMDLALHITAKAKGTTTVTITLKNGVSKSFTLNVQ